MSQELISARIPSELKQQVSARAKQDKISDSVLVKLALEQYLENNPDKVTAPKPKKIEPDKIYLPKKYLALSSNCSKERTQGLEVYIHIPTRCVFYIEKKSKVSHPVEFDKFSTKTWNYIDEHHAQSVNLETLYNIQSFAELDLNNPDLWQTQKQKKYFLNQWRMLALHYIDITSYQTSEITDLIYQACKKVNVDDKGAGLLYMQVYQMVESREVALVS